MDQKELLWVLRCFARDKFDASFIHRRYDKEFADAAVDLIGTLKAHSAVMVETKFAPDDSMSIF